MLSSTDDLSVPKRHGILRKSLSEEPFAEIERIPPKSDKLFENLPWLTIMADLAIAAAIAEIKVRIFFEKQFRDREPVKSEKK